MGSGNSRIIMHTNIQPEAPEEAVKRGWKRPKLPKLGVLRARTVRRPKRLRTTGEKLLANTAIACALLVGVMAAGSINTPWAKKVSSAVSNAVTMRMDLDETLGRLQFVRNILPDAVLVFWNMGTTEWASPVSGTITHAYHADAPYLLYRTDGQAPVFAVQNGTVTAVTQNDRDEWTIVLEHDDGVETVYAYLAQAMVKPGQSVAKGAQIALSRDGADATVYFEMRVAGMPSDPSARLGA